MAFSLKRLHFRGCRYRNLESGVALGKKPSGSQKIRQPGISRFYYKESLFSVAPSRKKGRGHSTNKGVEKIIYSRKEPLADDPQASSFRLKYCYTMTKQYERRHS